MSTLTDITKPLTEIEVATLVQVGGIFARRLAYQRDRLREEVQQLRAEVQQLREANYAKKR